MDDLSGCGDPDVDVFVDANISSFAAWDIVVYFEANPDLSVAASELASRLGRQETEIEPVMRGLADRGIVRMSLTPDGVKLHSLSHDPSVRRVVSRFVELARTREIRLEFVRRVLAGMARI